MEQKRKQRNREKQEEDFVTVRKKRGVGMGGGEGLKTNDDVKYGRGRRCVREGLPQGGFLPSLAAS